MTEPQVDPIDEFVLRVTNRMLRFGVRDNQAIEEVHQHLVETAEALREPGVPTVEAEREAIRRFGDPEEVTAEMARVRLRSRYRILLPLAVAAGVLITYVDAQPTWDDTGMTAGALALGAGLLGAAAPRRAWLWALAIGAGIPAVEIASTHNVGSVLALGIALFAAYAGAGLRMAVQTGWT